ncbi:hypothetical protein NKG94_05435 [Micromonospora sp. M12]
MEKAAALRPDLVVGDWWPAEKAHSGMEEGVDEKSKKLADLAPSSESRRASRSSRWPRVRGPRREPRRRRGQPADRGEQEALRGGGGHVQGGHREQAGPDRRGDVPSTEKVYVANPEYAPELLDLQTWGLKVINPASPDPAFPYWENLSWEKADTYQPDLILWDGRSFTPTANAEWGTKQPTWFRIKAAKAGATVSWPAFWLHTYGDFATELDKLTQAVKAADQNVGS